MMNITKESKILKFLLPIIVEGNKLSIGRILLISIFILSMVKWQQNIDIVPSMLKVLIALLVYVLGGKMINLKSKSDKSVEENKVNNSKIDN